FDGDDVLLTGRQRLKCSVESRRLAAAGRPGHQEDAIGSTKNRCQRREPVRFHSQRLQSLGRLVMIKDAQLYSFAMQRRHDGNAKVDELSKDGLLDPPVLR